MNKIKVLSALLLGMLLMSGCGMESFNEDEAELWSEYISYRMLMNEDNYRWKLVEESSDAADADNLDEMTGDDSIKDNEESNETDKTNESDKSNNAGNDSGEEKEPDDKSSEGIGNIKYNERFTKLLGYDGLEIQYDSYEAIDKVTSGILEIKADEGHVYYVVWFKLINNSSDTITVSLSDKKITYQLHVNLSTVYKSRINLLSNDIRFLETEIKSGETYMACALFLVPYDTVVKELETIISFGEESLIYKLK